MKIQKKPLLSDLSLPSLDTIRKVSGTDLPDSSFAPVFYDIETTGLSKSNAFVYLIGVVTPEEDTWQLQQFFAESPEDEKELLSHFAAFLENYTHTIQYNGNSFDEPFLVKRMELYEIADPFADKQALDLYILLKPLKSLLKLPGMKQPQMEAFLDLPSRNFVDGKECIRLYKKYMAHRAPEDLLQVLGHNEEDLLGLLQVFGMSAYLQLEQGEYSVLHAGYHQGQLILELHVSAAFPREFSCGNPQLYLTGKGRELKLLFPADGGKVKQFYANYKEYDYLPGEDTAIPRSLSAYMDKSLRVRAKAETCYTWFDCTGAFLTDVRKQETFLHNTLPCLLKQL